MPTSQVPVQPSSDTLLFSDLAIATPILKAIRTVGYEQPSPIQAACIPHLLEGADLLGTAQTGTGKTAAFALPLLSRLDLKAKHPQVLVLAPTRELAIQVAEAFQRYACNLKGFHVLPIYGGQDYATQLRQLKRGPQVIVGTPGRVMDHLRRGSLSLDGLTTLVLDEADEMLRMGFIDDVEWILKRSPADRQTALFSATMPKEIRKVANRYLNEPHEVKIESRTTTGDNIEQCYWMVSGTNKLDGLTRILEVEPFDAMLIFVRTKTATVELTEKLEARGYSAAHLNGDMSQQLRERAISRLKKNKLDILVATDVAARGIDVERVSHVINYDIPYDNEAYVHRIGRTGRAGRNGKAILFVDPREKRLLQSIERATRQPLTAMELPSGETITAQRIHQFKRLLKDTLAQQDLSFFEEVLTDFSHDHDVAPEDIASALAFLVQRDRPLRVSVAKTKPPKAASAPRRNSQKDKTRHRRSDKGTRPVANMVQYRLEVGSSHGAGPGDIVGAIANEAGIDNNHIGSIKVHEDFSTIDLPEGMPRDIYNHLRNVHVRGQKLRISVIGEASAAHSAFNTNVPRKNKTATKSKRKSGGKPVGRKGPKR